MFTPKARIVVVEDDLSIRSALDSVLSAKGYEVQAEPDGSRILEVMEQFRPDLAILDVSLPEGPNGYEIARLIGGVSNVPVVFITAADSLDARLAGFQAGADDYLTKPFSMPEVLARVQAVLRRTGRLTSSVWQVGDLIVDEDSHKVLRAGTQLELTPIEQKLLSCLVRNAGRTVSKSQLLTGVWGYDEYDINLVEVHMSSLRRKLEKHGPRMVHTVRGAGYEMRAP